MVIWTGWGILVPIIAFVCLLLTQAVTDAVVGEPGYYSEHDVPKTIALLVAAAAVWFLGRYFNGKPGRRLVDKDTGEEFVVEPRHSLFWIKMEYWAVALVVAAFAIPFL